MDAFTTIGGNLVEEGTVSIPVHRIRRGSRTRIEMDHLAAEQPLEIRLQHDTEGTERSIAVTMRTPGQDVELAVGFLHGEGILRKPTDLADASDVVSCPSAARNAVTVRLASGVAFDAERLDRNFYTTSSCGVCGKTSIAAIETQGAAEIALHRPMVSAAIIHALPDALLSAQQVFDQTGGLHAAALFAADGTLLSVREDVGRHNAVDKLVGACFLAGELPLSDHILLVSGRASFELVQKAVMAGIPIMAAVGAPSSLAVDLADRFGVTLAGFVREDRFNLYATPQRVQ